MRIYNHWSMDSPGLHFEPPRLHSERQRPSIPSFWASKATEFWLQRGSRSAPAFPSDVDQDPACLSNAYPDPASQNKADPCGAKSKKTREGRLQKKTSHSDTYCMVLDENTKTELGDAKAKFWAVSTFLRPEARPLRSTSRWEDKLPASTIVEQEE